MNHSEYVASKIFLRASGGTTSYVEGFSILDCVEGSYLCLALSLILLSCHPLPKSPALFPTSLALTEEFSLLDLVFFLRFIYLFMAVMSLHCCVALFSNCSE